MWMLRICVGLMMVIVVGGIGALALERLMYHDPFAVYAAIMPGHSVDALEDYPCRFRATKRASVVLGYCQFEPEYGLLSEVTLTIRNDVIAQTTAFDIPANTLRLGDLILCWGKPTAMVYAPSGESPILDLYWKEKLHVQVTPGRYDRGLSYFLTVDYLSLSGQWQPCGTGA